MVLNRKYAAEVKEFVPARETEIERGIYIKKKKNVEAEGRYIAMRKWRNSVVKIERNNDNLFVIGEGRGEGDTEGWRRESKGEG